MQMTQSHKPFKKINYYPLNNGFVDVYLHKNETQEVDEEGNIQYVAEEVHFQIDVKTTKEMIEENFEFYWGNEGEVKVVEQTDEQMLRDYVLELDMRTIMLEFGL